MKRSVFVLICLFFAALPARAAVVINEIAWMGTAESASNEWIELFSDTEQNLNGWVLATEDGGLKLHLKGTTTGYYLIERTDDNSVSGVKADLFAAFGKGLSNDGEILMLYDADGNVVDKIDGGNGWAIGGDNDSKNTLQRNSAAPKGWVTAVATPKAKNANYVRPKPKTTPTVSSPTAKSGAEPKVLSAASAASEERLTDNNLFASAKSTEYWWLLGGILGGAVLGLLCVIIAKWKKSP